MEGREKGEGEGQRVGITILEEEGKEGRRKGRKDGWMGEGRLR